MFRQSTLPMAFVVYPILLLVGTRLGLSGAVIAINLLALFATASTLHGSGPFSLIAPGHVVTRVILVQIYLALSMVMLLPVSVARVRRLTTERQLSRAWRKMEALASADGLTGVANRRRFDAVLDEEWRRALREHKPLALLMVDADYFKAFNDNYGHVAGDACLRSIAGAISRVPQRAGDLVARYGGEEFAVLLPGIDAVSASEVAEQVRDGVRLLDLPHKFSATQRVTVSVGCSAMVPSAGLPPEVLIEASDRALYRAKQAGRDRVEMAETVAAPVQYAVTNA